jgi:hypothetical protein
VGGVAAVTAAVEARDASFCLDLGSKSGAWPGGPRGGFGLDRGFAGLGDWVSYEIGCLMRLGVL